MIDYLKRVAMGRPFAKPPHEGPYYGSVIERTMAWMVDIIMIYTLGGHLLGWLTGMLYGVQGSEALFAVKRDVANDMLTQFNLAVQQMEPMQLLGSPSFHLVLLENLLGYALVGVVIVCLQIFWGQTPGKWLMGLKVVRRSSFAEISPVRYVLRYLAYLVAVLPLMVGIIWADFNREKRGWHDMLVGTVVIHTRPPGWYWAQVKRGFGWAKAKIS